MLSDELDNFLIILADFIILIFSVIHQQVNHLPGVNIVLSQPQQSHHHDGVVGGADGLQI